jgi:hypothetical protein
MVKPALLTHKRHGWISCIGTLCNARRYSGMTLANLITLAHVRRQLKLENRAFVDSPRHPNGLLTQDRMLNIRSAPVCIASMAFMTKFTTTCCN